MREEWRSKTNKVFQRWRKRSGSCTFVPRARDGDLDRWCESQNSKKGFYGVQAARGCTAERLVRCDQRGKTVTNVLPVW